MFRVDIDAKALIPIDATTFADLKVRERYDLQEWLVSRPDALGEELLIIQKEYSGFEGTRERLDLLALDKTGNLVIIENKIDDSGKDVVWQALKYASYCAGLTKKQTIDIFQAYLDKYQYVAHTDSHDAKQCVQNFLAPAESGIDFAEMDINVGNSQRIMLVAAYFPKEVTNTVLWLNAQGLNIQCIKITPYEHAQQIFVNIDRIIPTPEESDFLVTTRAKEAEIRDAETLRTSKTHALRFEYWTQLLATFKDKHCALFQNISPSKDNWLSATADIKHCRYSLVFGQKFIRVELVIARHYANENKVIFDKLLDQKLTIEQAFGGELSWLRMNENKVSCVLVKKSVEGYDKVYWDEYIQWHFEQLERLDAAIKTPLAEIVRSVPYGQ